MKIHNERLEGLPPQEVAPKAVPSKAAPPDGRDFEEMLARQLEREAGGAPAPPLAGLGSLNPLLLADQIEPDDAALLSGLAGQTEDLLGAWDQYAATLVSGETSAKSAWAMLAGLDARVQGLRAGIGKLGTQGQGLDAVLNELEVLAATEKFKFNRGDYQ